MGSSWRYRHVTVPPYSIGWFHGFGHTFFTGSNFALMDDSQAGWNYELALKQTEKQIGPIGLSHLFTAFSNPGKPPLYPTRSHLLWSTQLFFEKTLAKTKNQNRANQHSNQSKSVQKNKVIVKYLNWVSAEWLLDNHVRSGWLLLLLVFCISKLKKLLQEEWCFDSYEMLKKIKTLSL